jgi:hypothetical protein
MSYTSEHKRFQPILAMARANSFAKFDIATNPETEALFEAGSGGFQICCTQEDHPKGWGVYRSSPAGQEIPSGPPCRPVLSEVEGSSFTARRRRMIGWARRATSQMERGRAMSQPRMAAPSKMMTARVATTMKALRGCFGSLGIYLHVRVHL